MSRGFVLIFFIRMQVCAEFCRFVQVQAREMNENRGRLIQFSKSLCAKNIAPPFNVRACAKSPRSAQQKWESGVFEREMGKDFLFLSRRVLRAALFADGVDRYS